MRILIAATPPTGVSRVQCLLGSVYRLDRVPRRDSPQALQAAAFREWAEAGKFRDGTVFNMSFPFSPELVEAAAAVPAHLLTLLRDPYDMFVALYLSVQARTVEGGDERGPAGPTGAIANKPIDHPDVLAFLERSFGLQLTRMNVWVRRRRAIVLRYEEMNDPSGDGLRRAIEAIAPVAPIAPERMTMTLKACGVSAAPLARDAPTHAQGLAVGVWRRYLTDEHLAIFRDTHGDPIRSLGYEVYDHVPPREEEPEPAAEAEAVATSGDGDELYPELENLNPRLWGFARKGYKQWTDEQLPPRDHFAAVGERMVRYFVDDVGLRPDEHVLDPGCGIGRIAIPLTKYLTPEAHYEGFDVEAEAVKWCQDNITPRFPNFRFQVADIYSKMYNPKATQRSSTYRFPYDDESFSFAFLTSVFTHMEPDDVTNYLREINRVLKPDGRCFITMFVLTPEALEDVEQQLSHPAFPHDKGRYRLKSEQVPEQAVAYHEDYVRRLFAESGLSIVDPVRFGGWSKRKVTGSGPQDWIVARKSGSPVTAAAAATPGAAVGAGAPS